MLLQILKIVWKHRGQNALLLLEIFISFLILAGAFAYIIFNFNMFTSPLGFQTQDKLMILFSDSYTETDSAVYEQKIKALEADLRNRPEVESISFGNSVYPFSWNSWQSVSEQDNVKIEFNTASMDERFAETMGLEVAEGRWLSKPVAANAMEEVVVNRLFLAKNFGGRNLIDSVVNLNGDKRIAGIIEHYKYNGEFTAEVPIVISYQNPYNQQYANCLYVKLKQNTPVVFEEQLSKLIYENTGIKDFIIRNLNADRAESSRPTWINLYSITALTIFLIINVAMGLFGVLWYNINKRRSEISLRKALGATGLSIMLQLTAEMVSLAVVALFIGCLIFWQIAWYELINFAEKTILYQGMAYAAIFVVLLVLLCSAYPAWRAARLNPIAGLRDE